MLSLHENTAERSPPLSPPEGTAITSASRPANSSDRCARSFPAHSSMHPNGRCADVVHANIAGSTLLTFIANLMRPPFHSLRGLATCHQAVPSPMSGRDGGRIDLQTSSAQSFSWGSENKIVQTARCDGQRFEDPSTK